MGLFTRRAHPVDGTTTANGHHTTGTTGTTAPVVGNGAHHSTGNGVHHEKGPRMGGGMFKGRNHGTYPEALNSRPTFGQWVKGTWLDIVTMVILGAIGLGIYMAPPAPSRSFPITFIDGEIVYPQFGYPLRNEIIPIWASALMSFFIPFAVFLICAIRVRSFWDINNATLGILYSLIGAAVFQVFCKWYVNYYASCESPISREILGPPSAPSEL